MPRGANQARKQRSATDRPLPIVDSHTEHGRTIKTKTNAKAIPRHPTAVKELSEMRDDNRINSVEIKRIVRLSLNSTIPWTGTCR
jgi:hypothetical protein